VNRLASGLVGAVVEAWAELRIHRTRVLLSLIGIAVAVCAITVVVGAGALLSQSQAESNERSGGRPAMLQISAFDPDSGLPVPMDEMDAAYTTAIQRYSIEFWSRNTYFDSRVQLSNGVNAVYGEAVDPDYATMHRVRLVEGRWFTAADANRIAPAVVINDDLWAQLGSPDLETHPTVELMGEPNRTAVVIGVTPSSSDYVDFELTLMWSDVAPHLTAQQLAENSATYELWVPPELSVQLEQAVLADFQGSLGDDVEVQVSRSDYLSYVEGDPLLPLKLAVGGVAGLVLLLGALGLVNIALVTVRQRIREIGIRRSFGATAGRVFFAVMMESIVASVAAGVIGVAVAVLIVQNPFVREKLAGALIDVPAFPIEAALIGLVSAAGVGALAGLLPALVAVRVKVIDAIRY